MKQLLILILPCCALITLAQPKVITAGLQHPESIISDGKFFYATNRGTVLKSKEKS